MTLKAFALSALVSIAAGLVVAAVLISLVGCAVVEQGDTSACERALATTNLQDAECALVYECTSGAELCIREQDLEAAEQANGLCLPSRDERFTRFDPLSPIGASVIDPYCFWHCGDGRGCNSLSGCFCEGAL